MFLVNLNIFEFEAKASARAELLSASEFWGFFMSNSTVVQYVFVLLYMFPVFRCHVQCYPLCNNDFMPIFGDETC